MSGNQPRQVSTPCVPGQLPAWNISGYSIQGQGRQMSVGSRASDFSIRGREEEVGKSIGDEDSSGTASKEGSTETDWRMGEGGLGESNAHRLGEEAGSFNFGLEEEGRANPEQSAYWSARGVEKKLTSSRFNFNFSTPELTSNPSPYFQMSSPSNFPSLPPANQTRLWESQLEITSPGQMTDKARQRKPDKSVTFNNEDLFNIYERDNSTSFELCSPLKESSAKNPFATPSQSNSLTSLPFSTLHSTSSQSLDEMFKKPGKPVSAHRSSGVSSSPDAVQPVHSATFLDQSTANKLSSFSHRLRSLTSPSIPHTPLKPTPRGNLVTPKNKTPDSRHTTPHSVISTPMGCTSTNPDPSCFVAILEGRGSAKGEVGIAAICLTNPRLVLCQFSDSSTYPRTLTKLLAINPAHVITPDSGSAGVKLYEDISNHLQMATVVPVQRKHYNESKGMQAIKQLLVPEFASVELQFHNKFYCLAAANALIKYVEYTENFMFARKSLKVEYQVAEQSTIIDPATAEHIELMSSLGQKKSKLSLFGVLNHCSTQGGVRLLRSNLFQPPINSKVIANRLEVVEEMIDNMSLHNNLKNLISRFPDLDPVLTLCVKRPEVNISSVQIDAKIDRMVALKQVLELLPPLHQLLQGSISCLCKDASSMLSKHMNTGSLLLEMMNLVQ